MVWSRNIAEDFTDDAEEALSEMYDGEIHDFNEDAHEHVQEACVARLGVHLPQPPDDQHQAPTENTD